MTEIREFMQLFCKRTGEMVKWLSYLPMVVSGVERLYGSVFSKEIKGDQLLIKWEDFDCRKHSMILQNYLSVDQAGSIRVHVAFGFPVKLVYYLNGQGVYLNSGQDLTVDCGYVFDIPMNPSDSLNLAVSFDDSESTTARCKFLRLQEVR